MMFTDSTSQSVPSVLNEYTPGRAGVCPNMTANLALALPQKSIKWGHMGRPPDEVGRWVPPEGVGASEPALHAKKSLDTGTSVRGTRRTTEEAAADAIANNSNKARSMAQGGVLRRQWLERTSVHRPFPESFPSSFAGPSPRAFSRKPKARVLP